MRVSPLENPYKKYHTFLQRLFAYTIDLALLSPLLYVSRFVNEERGPLSTQAVLFWQYAQIAIFFGYFILFHSIYGRTIGKMFLGAALLDLSERKASFWRILRRELPGLFFVIYAASMQVPDILAGNNTSVGGHPILENGYSPILVLCVLWVISEQFSQLLSRRRRSFQDAISGTAHVSDPIADPADPLGEYISRCCIVVPYLTDPEQHWAEHPFKVTVPLDNNLTATGTTH